MNEFYKYEPEVAAKMFQHKPEDCHFPISTFPDQFGITQEEMRAELIAGRLVASGEPNGRGGYSRVTVNGIQLLDWIASGSAIAQKALDHVKGLRP